MNMFNKEMAAGRGFIALAASAMGQDTPIGGLLVSLLFGASQAFGNEIQPSYPMIMELIQMIPYVVTLIGLAVFSYIVMKRKEKLSGK